MADEELADNLADEKLACHNIGGSSLRECVAASPVSRFEGERGGIGEEREST